MKKIALIILLFVNLTFSQNGIEAYEGRAIMISQNENLYNMYFTYTDELQTLLITDKVLRFSGVRELEVNKEYLVNFQVIKNKPIVFYVEKSITQKAKDLRDEIDKISPIMIRKHY